MRQVTALEQDPAAGRFREPENGPAEARFSPARFTDQPESFPFLDFKRNSVDGPHRPGFGEHRTAAVVLDSEVLYLQITPVGELGDIFQSRSFFTDSRRSRERPGPAVGSR